MGARTIAAKGMGASCHADSSTSDLVDATCVAQGCPPYSARKDRARQLLRHGRAVGPICYPSCYASDRGTERRMIGMLVASAIVGELSLSHAATVAVRRRTENQIVAMTVTDSSGRFRLEVPPGIFDVEIRPQVPDGEAAAFERDTFVLQNIGVMPGQTAHMPALLLKSDAHVVRGSIDAPGIAIGIWEQEIHFGFGRRLHANDKGEFVLRVSPWSDVTAEVNVGGETLTGYCPQDRFHPPTPGSVAECIMHFSHGRPWMARPVFEWILPRLGNVAGGAVLQGTVDGNSGSDPVSVDLLRARERGAHVPSHALAAFYSGGRCLDCVELDAPWERFEFRGGTFEIPSLPAGEMLVRLSSAGSRRIVVADLRERRVTKLEVRLFGNASVRAHLLHPLGFPLELASACLEASGAVLRCADSDSKGRIRLDGLPPGQWNLRIGAEAAGISLDPLRTPIARTITLAEDGTVDIGTVVVDLDAP